MFSGALKVEIISVQLSGLNDNGRNLSHFVREGVLDLHNIGLGNLNVQSLRVLEPGVKWNVTQTNTERTPNEHLANFCC